MSRAQPAAPRRTSTRKAQGTLRTIKGPPGRGRTARCGGAQAGGLAAVERLEHRVRSDLVTTEDDAGELLGGATGQVAPERVGAGARENVHKSRRAQGRGDVQRGLTLTAGLIGVGPMADELGDDGVIAGRDRASDGNGQNWLIETADAEVGVSPIAERRAHPMQVT